VTERRVALVKSAGRADAFAVALRAAGFVPVLVSPFQREAIPEGEERLERSLAAARALGGAGVWVAVTSAHAVPGLSGLGDLLEGARFAAVGGGTATALHAVGFDADVIGDGGGAALAREMLAAGVTPRETVLHPCNEAVRRELAIVLADAGIDVTTVPVYRMVPDAVGERAARGEFHAVVVASPRLAARAAELFADRPPAVAIGRTTAAALRDLGWPPRAVAAGPTPADVAAAVTNVT
jgi:uroporphyrinogen-III synthase